MYLVQRVPEGDLRRYLRYGVARGLGRQRRGAGDAGVDLDHSVVEADGVQSELTVASPDDAQGGYYVQRRAAEHLILPVGQGERRSHDDAVAGVDSHGVHVLHAAHGDHVACAVAHGLEFYLFPAVDVPLHQDLSDGRRGDARRRRVAELLRRVRHTSAAAAQRIGGTDDDGIADLLRDVKSLFRVAGDIGGDHRLADRLHGLLEGLPVLRFLDGVHTGADETDSVLLEKALLSELHGEGETRLTPESRQETVGLFLYDDALYGLGSQRFEIHLVRGVRVGHDRGGVGVDQYRLHALRLQHPARLGPGVVEFRRLTDDDGAGADDQRLFDTFIPRHSFSPPSFR